MNYALLHRRRNMGHMYQFYLDNNEKNFGMGHLQFQILGDLKKYLALHRYDKNVMQKYYQIQLYVEK